MVREYSEWKIQGIIQSVIFKNIVRNLSVELAEGDMEDLEALEISWLEDFDEYVVNIGDELLFDDLTESEAEKVKELLEAEIERAVEKLKK